jgi:hypothetical protein
MENKPDNHRVSISGVDIDTEIVDRTANAWITVDVANHTLEDQLVLASVVVAQGENREQVEIAETIAPFGGPIEAVIRITDPTMWQADESGKLPLFDCLVGLEVEGEVEDVAAVKFDVG